ncbi:hypothetical protein A9Q78_11910 [Methylophaga sp. 41_12_T18]|nr:hypothetical protein A9Q78_11910 [Methylophaga sp. 41_12_T18]
MQKIALVVDDSRVARMTLSKLLVAQDFDVVEKASGEDALTYLLSEPVRPAIIFMDVMMGGMDGLAATTKIKSTPDLQIIPVVICTGNDSDADRDKAMAVGAKAVLSKPPVAEQLDAIVASITIAKPEAIVEPEQQAVTINEAELVASVMSKIEQDLLAQAKLHAREIAEDISRQIAEDTAEKVAKEHAKIETQAMLPELTATVSQAANTVAEETANRVCKVVANESVAKNAELAVQRAVNNLGLAEKMMAMLANEGATWLNRQQQQLQATLDKQLTESMPAKIEAYLQENLSVKIGPIVHAAVQEALPKTADTEQEDALALLTQRVSSLNSMVIGLGVAVVVLLVLSFVL